MEEGQKYIPRVIRRFPFIQIAATIFGSLCMLSCGMHYGWSSPALPKLLSNDSSYFSLTKAEILWIPVAMPYGGFFGTLVVACMLKCIGPKTTLTIAAVPLCVSWLMIARANSFVILLLARFLAGISGSIATCSLPIYVGEISNPELRGFLLSMITCLWIIGVLFMNILGSYVTIRNVAYISLSIPIIFGLSFLWMPESPYFLIEKGKIAQARLSIRILKEDQQVDFELNRLCAAIKTQKQRQGSFKELVMNRGNRKSVIIMMGTKAAQQFCGISGFLCYAQVIFDDAGTAISSKVASIICFSLLLIISCVSSILVDKTGRKPLLLISSAGTGIALLIETCYFYIKNETEINTVDFSLVPIIGFILYIVAFSIGLKTIPILLVGEIFPNSIRQLAVSFSAIYYYACGVIVVQLFQLTMSAYGLHVTFFITFVLSVLGTLFIFLYVPETKGLTLEEIEAKFNSY